MSHEVVQRHTTEKSSDRSLPWPTGAEKAEMWCKIPMMSDVRSSLGSPWDTWSQETQRGSFMFCGGLRLLSVGYSEGYSFFGRYAKPSYTDFGSVIGHSTEDDPLIVGSTSCRCSCWRNSYWWWSRIRSSYFWRTWSVFYYLNQKIRGRARAPPASKLKLWKIFEADTWIHVVVDIWLFGLEWWLWSWFAPSEMQERGHLLLCRRALIVSAEHEIFSTRADKGENTWSLDVQQWSDGFRMSPSRIHRLWEHEVGIVVRLRCAQHVIEGDTLATPPLHRSWPWGTKQGIRQLRRECVVLGIGYDPNTTTFFEGSYWGELDPDKNLSYSCRPWGVTVDSS